MFEILAPTAACVLLGVMLLSQLAYNRGYNRGLHIHASTEARRDHPVFKVVPVETETGPKLDADGHLRMPCEVFWVQEGRVVCGSLFTDGLSLRGEDEQQGRSEPGEVLLQDLQTARHRVLGRDVAELRARDVNDGQD